LPKKAAGKNVYLTREELDMVKALMESCIQSKSKTSGDPLRDAIFTRVTVSTLLDLKKKL